MLQTAFTKLTRCTVPIQQAGMGGVATPELAAAVARTGALGMIGGPMIPADAMAQMLDAIDTDTRSRVGVNFLMPFVDREAVNAAASRARVVEFFYAEPDASLVELVHSGGALAFWQVGSAEEAQAAVKAGCDAVIAQGTEAGGHVRGQSSLLPLLSQVLDTVDVPVIAAGGIGTPRSVAAALAAGASAVRLGTVFVASEECDAHPLYKEALQHARAEDTVLTEAYSVMWPDAPHRVLRSCIEAAEGLSDDIVGSVPMGEGMGSMPVPRFAIPCPTTDTTGKIEAMALYAGESVDAVRDIRPAADIVRELAERAEQLLRRW